MSQNYVYTYLHLHDPQKNQSPRGHEQLVVDLGTVTLQDLVGSA